MSGDVIRIDSAIVGPYKLKADLDAVLAFDPGDLFVDVPRALDGIGVDIRPPSLPLILILARLSGDRSSRRSFQISCYSPRIRYLIDVVRLLHNMAGVCTERGKI